MSRVLTRVGVGGGFTSASQVGLESITQGDVCGRSLVCHCCGAEALPHVLGYVFHTFVAPYRVVITLSDV